MTIPWSPMPAEQRAVRQAGPLLDSWQFQQAIAHCLERRLVPWLDEAGRQQGTPGLVPRPGWIGVWHAEAPALAAQSPRVLVSARKMERDALHIDGGVHCWWKLEVEAAVLLEDRAEAERLAGLYGAAIRACVGLSLVEDFEQAIDVRFRRERHVMPEPDAVQTPGISIQTFGVLAGPLFSLSGSLAPASETPTTPDDQGDQPTVARTHLELDASADLGA